MNEIIKQFIIKTEVDVDIDDSDNIDFISEGFECNLSLLDDDNIKLTIEEDEIISDDIQEILDFYNGIIYDQEDVIDKLAKELTNQFRR